MKKLSILLVILLFSYSISGCSIYTRRHYKNSSASSQISDLDRYYPHINEKDIELVPSLEVYGYNQLSKEQKFLFDVLWQDGIKLEGEAKVVTLDLKENRVSLSQWKQVKELFFNNNPVYRFQSFGYRPDTQTAETKNVVTGIEKYRIEYSVSEEAARPQVIQQEVDKIISALPKGKAEDEILYILAAGLCDTIEYDSDSEKKDKNEKQGEFTILGNDNHAHDCYGALIEKSAVCDGYAEAFSLLANAAGYQTIVVYSSTHAWNMVYLQGHWYHIDVTWMDTGEEGSYRDSYFLGNDRLFEDHLEEGESFSYSIGIPAPAAKRSYGESV